MTKAQQKLEELGATRYALAKRSGLSEATIKRLLDGDHDDPKLDTVHRIHVATGGKISYEDFVNPATTEEVKLLIEHHKPLRRAPGPGRPATPNPTDTPS